MTTKGRIAIAAIAAAASASGAARAEAPEAAAGAVRLAQSQAGLVWCHEPDRGLVTRQRRSRCRGRVVDADEARALQEERLRRIRRALKGPKPLVPGQRRRGSGSGAIVSAAGHVLTNRHVVAGCRTVTVAPFGADEVIARRLAEDAAHDFALLRARIERPAVAPFRGPEDPKPGDPVAVVGFPDRGLVAIRPVIVTGHVHIGGDAGRPDRYVLKIDVRPGNSGGPVLDRSARVVGIVVAQLHTPSYYAETGAVLRDVGFAIRPDPALAFLRRNGIAPAMGHATGETAGGLDDAALLARARRFTVRIGCWR